MNGSPNTETHCNEASGKDIEGAAACWFRLPCTGMVRRLRANRAPHHDTLAVREKERQIRRGNIGQRYNLDSKDASFLFKYSALFSAQNGRARKAS